MHSRFLLLLLIPAYGVQAQTGGNNTFEFLNLSSAARIAAMGGHVVSVRDNDLHLAFDNPGLLNDSMSKTIALSYVPYFADIKYGYAAYAQTFGKAGTFAAGMHYVDYGSFVAADATGTITGSFTAAEYAFNLSYARPLYGRIHAGATLKTIYSKLETYTSTGLAADVGASYMSRSNNLGVGLVLRNMGMQLKTYTPGDREPLPFEIQAGLTYRLPKAPLRLGIVLTHLEKWNLGYVDPEKLTEVDPITGDTTFNSVSFFEKVMRHVVVQGEIIITENFHLRIGYNYMRRKDLSVETRKSVSGFTGGFGFRINRFHLSYGRAAYHVAGGSNHFSISTNLDAFSKKRKAAD